MSPNHMDPKDRSRTAGLRRAGLAMGLGLALVGCAGFEPLQIPPLGPPRVPAVSAWRLPALDHWDVPALGLFHRPPKDPGPVAGPTLSFDHGTWQARTTAAPGTAEGDYQIGLRYFQVRNYDKANDAFVHVIHAHGGSPQAERALFMEAECLYSLKQYPRAADVYGEFVKTYPGSAFKADALQRQYAIATAWLDDTRPAPGKAGGVSLASFVNFDKTKPLLDEHGRAMGLLEDIRQNDATGPLAAESLLTTAAYYQAKGDVDNADFYYDILIHDYPKSPLQPQAHLRALDSKLQAYRGPEYDGRRLDEARKLVKTALTQFPELEKDRPLLHRKLDVIDDKLAERYLQTARWYQRVKKPVSARLYYQILIQKYPESRWAQTARAEMAALNQK